MFRWLQAFVRRELVSDVPSEMDLCLDCGKLVCSEGEFRDCERRKKRAAELVLGLAAPDGAEEGQTNQGACMCEADHKPGNDRLAENERHCQAK
jgi:hypothetical protein